MKSVNAGKTKLVDDITRLTTAVSFAKGCSQTQVLILMDTDCCGEYRGSNEATGMEAHPPNCFTS